MEENSGIQKHAGEENGERENREKRNIGGKKKIMKMESMELAHSGL